MTDVDAGMPEASARMSAAGPRTRSDKVSFFNLSEIGESVFAVRKDAPTELVSTFAALVNHEDPEGYSLGFARYAPNTIIPRHRHNRDQIVLVLEGSLRQGSRVLGPGCGYYTPAGMAYTVSIGPEGCCFVEFRHSRLDDVTTEMLAPWPQDYQRPSNARA